jgi:hypothetical protein
VGGHLYGTSGEHACQVERGEKVIRNRTNCVGLIPWD